MKSRSNLYILWLVVSTYLYWLAIGAMIGLLFHVITSYWITLPLQTLLFVLQQFYSFLKVPIILLLFAAMPVVLVLIHTAVEDFKIVFNNKKKISEVELFLVYGAGFLWFLFLLNLSNWTLLLGGFILLIELAS